MGDSKLENILELTDLKDSDKKFIIFMHQGSPHWKRSICEHGKSFYCQICVDLLDNKTKKMMEGVKA